MAEALTAVYVQAAHHACVVLLFEEEYCGEIVLHHSMNLAFDEMESPAGSLRMKIELDVSRRPDFPYPVEHNYKHAQTGQN